MQDHGDFEPLSMNQEFAEKDAVFKPHGADHAVGHLHMACSTQIASRGAVTIAQESTFLKPVKIGDTITAVGEVTQKIMEKKIVIVRTTCSGRRDGDGRFRCGIDAGALGGTKKWL